MAGELLRIVMDGDDAAFAAALRKAFRTPGASPVLIGGDLGALLHDASSAAAWLTLVVEAPRPMIADCAGVLGQRGLALLLAADVASLRPDSALAEGWRDTPGLAALAVRRGGRKLARALLLDAPATLDDLVVVGLASRELPEVLVERFDAGFGSRKRALRAALELPFAEALAFDLTGLDEDDAA
ncbi:hypothetical protein IP69_03600 [Bosea sp. AAP35]|uniref:hypothetical protein n=1 Tax=Bosea sp. AAP35 TaxID=1523417 RepID=UPI0006B93374|nr:hypothetical protein [Bosea sp. AAP35]KPF72428.1 hypothetical protein IP69_03600 [Bosea sp. AAP35]